jgi:hypothetical protein
VFGLASRLLFDIFVKRNSANNDKRELGPIKTLLGQDAHRPRPINRGSPSAETMQSHPARIPPPAVKFRPRYFWLAVASKYMLCRVSFTPVTVAIGIRPVR